MISLRLYHLGLGLDALIYIVSTIAVTGFQTFILCVHDLGVVPSASLMHVEYDIRRH